MPPGVKMAKEIMEDIEKEERLGMIGANEMSNYDELEEDQKKLL